MDLKKPPNSLINKLASYLYKNIKHRGISLLFDYRRPRVHNDHKFLLWSTPTLLICRLYCSNITIYHCISLYHCKLLCYMCQVLNRSNQKLWNVYAFILYPYLENALREVLLSCICNNPVLIYLLQGAW